MVKLLDKELAADNIDANEDAMPQQPLSEIIRNLDAQIAALEQHLQRLKYARWAIEDPGVFQRLNLAAAFKLEDMQAFSQVPLCPPTDGGAMPQAAAGVTHFGKIVMYLNAKQNAWTTSKQIAGDVGVSESVVREVLYKTHKEHFERTQNTEGRGKLFRLLLGGQTNDQKSA